MDGKYWLFGGHNVNTYERQIKPQTNFKTGKLPLAIHNNDTLTMNISPIVWNNELYIFLTNGAIYKHDGSTTFGDGKEWVKVNDNFGLSNNVHKILDVTENMLASYNP